MAAKVMLRQARAYPDSGELATGDIVIEALIAAGISPKLLAKAIGRRKGSSEAHWWGKFEHRLDDPDDEVDRAKRPRLGTPEHALPRFSLHHIVRRNYKREIRLHNVAPESPIRQVIGYILQGLVEAIYPGRLTEVRTDEREEKFLISFGLDNVLEASVMGPRRAESMFRSFANYGIAEERVAEFFAGHSENGTKDLFSHGIAKLFATPDKSHFAIVVFPDHFEVRAKHVEGDQQRLDRAKHLSETIIDLARLGVADAANTLLPLLVSDLKNLWDETDREPLDWDNLKFSELHGTLEILLKSQQEAAVLQEDDELVLQQSDEPTPEVDPVWRRV
jgi:hypothetical protein